MLSQQSPKMWRHTHVLEWRLIEFAVGLLVIAVAFGTVWYLTTPVNQNEQQATGFANTYAPLDQHERHPAGLGTTYAPLDQHERHPLPNLANPAAAPAGPTLDLDDRYPLPNLANPAAAPAGPTLDLDDRYPLPNFG